ncbi:MAG TPA: DUF72 domain-containing protein [Caulobacteraceae bacterium]|nr:DUF72 domain-containing protein [Caulobacteraceae bacterium]
MAEIRIGCSGWSYHHWRGAFYPLSVRAADRLEFYARRFDTVEINGSFYRLPSDAAVRHWAAAAPARFVFSWKVSRFISHNKKLKDCAEPVERVFSRMAPLGKTAGPALVQLPPMLKRDEARLTEFLELMRGRGRIAFEFRRPDWYAASVMQVLADYGAALCISDHAAAPAPWEITTNFLYLRAHGPGGRYHGRYPRPQLQRWAERMRAAAEGGRDVYGYFDNDVKAAAPADAQALKALLARGG